MLAGSNLSAISGMVETVRVADTKGLPADAGCNNKMVDSNTDTVVVDDDEEISDEEIRKRKSSKPRSSEGRAKQNERKMKLRKARKAARITYGQLERGGADAGGGENRRDGQASELI